MERSPISPSAILRRILVLAVLVAGTAGTACALVHVLESRVPLRIVLGKGLWAAAAGLAAAVLLGTASLVRELGALRRSEARERGFATVRALIVVSVCTWLAFLALVRPVEILWLEIAAGLGFGVFCAWLALHGRSARASSGLARGADLVLFSSCAAALGLELSLRAIALLHPAPILQRYGDPPRVVAQRSRFPGGFEYLGSRCNSAGYYDEEFRRKAPGEQLAVAIGDSFSTGSVPHPYHFTTVCERELGVPVDNMGVNGIGPPEYLRMLVEEALLLDPDVVVIDVFVGNDLLVHAPRRGRVRRLLESWFDRGNVLLWTVPQRLAHIAKERRLRGGKGPIASVESAQKSAVGTLEERFPWVLDPHEETGTFSESAFLAVETRRAAENSRLVEAQLAPFFAALLEMRRAAGSIPVCVMLIPDEFQVEDAVWEQVFAASSHEDLVRDRAQDLLLPWFEENGIPCLDLLPVLRAVPPMEDGRRHVYHLRDTHFNARGNKAVGEALARFLRRWVGKKG